MNFVSHSFCLESVLSFDFELDYYYVTISLKKRYLVYC